MRKPAPVLALVLVTGACTTSPPAEESSPSVAAVTFEMMTKEKTHEGCVAGAEDCTYIRFDYPVVVDAPTGTNVEALTRAVHDFLIQPLAAEEFEDAPDEEEASDEEPRDATVNGLMDDFVFDFMRFKEEFPDSSQSWFLERKALLHHNAPDVVSLSLTERSHTDEAHATERIRFVNIDPRTGTTIALYDLIEPSSIEQLETIAEARFRLLRNVEEGVSLEEAGFTFENGDFQLTDNFGIGAEELTFYYNPYEVAPYAMGPTELTVPYDAIRDILVERSPVEPEPSQSP